VAHLTHPSVFPQAVVTVFAVVATDRSGFPLAFSTAEAVIKTTIAMMSLEANTRMDFLPKQARANPRYVEIISPRANRVEAV
jgi:hypothetical protein